eukprot:3335956-Pleurochrysis_carterae.AAC.1
MTRGGCTAGPHVRTTTRRGDSGRHSEQHRVELAVAVHLVMHKPKNRGQVNRVLRYASLQSGQLNLDGRYKSGGKVPMEVAAAAAVTGSS